MSRSLEDITYKVKHILMTKPSTRNSDSLLYAEICLQIQPVVNQLSFPDVLRRRDELGLPCMESVRRARQKLQSENAELRGSKDVRAKRAEKEKEFKAYALQ